MERKKKLNARLKCNIYTFAYLGNHKRPHAWTKHYSQCKHTKTKGIGNTEEALARRRRDKRRL